MPLYEYSCRDCGLTFEALVRTNDTPACSGCAGTDLERLLSLFAVDSEGTRDAARQTSMPRSVKRHQEREIGEHEDYQRHRH